MNSWARMNRLPASIFNCFSGFRFMLLPLFLLTATVWADEAGTVVFAAGEARIGDRVAEQGATVAVGDQLETGKDGYLYIKTVDEGFLILRPTSRAVIASYHTDPDNPANNRIRIELQSGVARNVSGNAVKAARDRFRFNTPVAAIGVRGTDFTVFTDERTTRVAVLAGGVVVSGFNGACGPEGIGPCEGANSLELFASSKGVLQVNRGRPMPRLLQGKRAAPDAVAPPRDDEPEVTEEGLGKSKSKGARLGDANLAPLKHAGLNDTARPTLPTRNGIGWGRWQPVADQGADVDLDALVSEYQVVGVTGPFALLRHRQEHFVAPRQGQVTFGLRNAQAIVHSASSGDVPAAIENARLAVDFGSKRFSTQFYLVTDDLRVSRRATGSVTADGSFGNATQSGPSSMIVNGVLGGAGDDMSAAYLFQSRINHDMTATGVTIWGQ